MKKIVVLLLTFNGFLFIACNDDSPLTDEDKPYGELQVQGIVTDTNLQPIDKIQIVVHGEGNIYDTLFTNKKGEYEKPILSILLLRIMTLKQKTLMVMLITDTLKDTTIAFSIEQNEFVGASGKWYVGKATKIIDFKLTKNKTLN